MSRPGRACLGMRRGAPIWRSSGPLFSLVVALALLAISAVAGAAEETGAAEEPGTDAARAERINQCVTCHGDGEIMVDEMARFHVTEADLADDIHWQKGLRCTDCHGGNPEILDFRQAHAEETGFRSIKTPADVPDFCGHCHSNVEFMRQYDPSPRVDQVSKYWTSGHGQRLKKVPEDKVATCVSCHGHHGIRAVDDLKSPVFPTNVAKTCGQCHSDEQLMAGRTYQGRPLGHNQVELWSKSVHAEALLKKDDLSAPTCNDCHGNHGALPPNVDSVTNACGSCHVKVAELFSQTKMKHRFETAELPGCATCHHYHDITTPSDAMLGMQGGAVCTSCHEKRQLKFGATLAGAQVAKQMRDGLEQLKHRIARAEDKLDQAERLGMEVRAPRFKLREAVDALTNARTLVHSFAIEPMKKALDRGLQVTDEVEAKAEEALREHTRRRIWLAISMVPILVVVGLLLLYIRTLPPPSVEPLHE